MRWKIALAAAAAAALLTPAFAQDGAGDGAGNGAGNGNGTKGEEIGHVGVLHPARGAGVTYQYCAACHSEMLVAQQGLTRQDWDELLQWMVDKQGMEPIPAEDRETILDYLAEHYNTDRPHFPR